MPTGMFWKPIGYFPNSNLMIWECADCGALVNDVPKHGNWHAEQKVHDHSKVDPCSFTRAQSFGTRYIDGCDIVQNGEG